MARPALFDHPHRRLNLLTGEHLLVSPHRTGRPWQGAVERVAPPERPLHDPSCYLCPGNVRAGGRVNPAYEGTFVFDNDYAALVPDVPDQEYESGGLLRASSERGRCRVVCFSPRHDLTLGDMDAAAVRRVVDVWIDEFRSLGDDPHLRYVQVFENRGEQMGCSNPHPHGQIWANEHVPVEPAKETRRQAEYEARGRCLLCDYLELELREGERIVFRNAHFVALVPFWAVWPFETMVLPARHHGAITELSGDERVAFADILRRLARRYDRVFGVPFPYSMGLHQKPVDGAEHPRWHLHAHYYPPLLRSATVRKFMVGYELLGQPQRDITPEAAAERLRALDDA